VAADLSRERKASDADGCNTGGATHHGIAYGVPDESQRGMEGLEFCFLDDPRRGPALFDGHPHNASAAGLDDIAANDLVFRPVGALDEYVGLNGRDDVERCVFVEHDDRVHTPERAEHFGAFVLRGNRAGGSLDGAD